VTSAEPLRYRRVLAEGHYLVQGQIFIDNRQHHGRAGYHVVTPLRLEPGPATVLVNRGWIARGKDYPKPPEVAVPEGRVSVEGIASEPPGRVLELSGDTVSGSVWQNLSIGRYVERTRIEVLPVILLARHPAPGLAVVEEKPDTGIAKHQEYALTWLALAATVAALWIALNLRRDA
jgi:surfeit locus 1 family protein